VCQKCIWGRGSALNPGEGAYSDPSHPLAASPQNAFPTRLLASNFCPSRVLQYKFLATPIGSVAIKIDAKHFASIFKEKVEKHSVVTDCRYDRLTFTTRSLAAYRVR